MDEVDLEGRYIKLSNKADEVRREARRVWAVFFCLFVCADSIHAHFSGSEHGELAGEAAGGVRGSHPLQVPGEVHPQGWSEGDGE